MEVDVPHRPGKLYTLKPEIKKNADFRKTSGTRIVNA